MDLKIEDVAELLNVSHETIEGWLVENKIPAYRMGEHYRFAREEIQQWMLDKQYHDIDESFLASKGPLKCPSGGSRQYSLFRAIYRGSVLHHIKGATKEELIRAVMSEVSSIFGLDEEGITSLLLDREALHSTALNNGIAVPHTRDFLLEQNTDIVIVAYPENPVVFGALDGKPVHTFFFLFAASDKRHLQLLAKIAHLASQERALEMLKKHPSKEELLEFIKDWEGTIACHGDSH